MATTVAEFSRVSKTLEDALAQEKNEFIRDSVIQRFEFCVELAWKTSKKVMGTTTSAPKQVIREMAQNNLISNVEIWLRAVDERNLSSHTYNEDLVEKVYVFVKDFYPEIQKLANKLEAM